MKIRRILSLILPISMIGSCVFNGGTYICSAESAVYRDVVFPALSVNDGEVIKGVDISSVLSLEKSGVVFKDPGGKAQDIFSTLKDAGVNYIRVRIWNNPWDSTGKTYGGGANDVQTAVSIAQRCRKYGLKMLVDFHYSDFWADPGKQYAPKEWSGYSVDQKAQEINRFTDQSLRKIAATGVKIGMVQVGNETINGMCGEYSWDNICRLMNSASSAIRNFDKNILIAVHMTNPEKANSYSYIAQQLASNRVDYDVFASSYYPYWHGTLNNLTLVLGDIARKYNKYVMVAETSWVNTFNDSDCFANTISDQASLGKYASYEVSVQGQINSVSDVFKAVADVGPKGIGVFYWEPAWITVGNDYNTNNQLWEKNGSGWATQAAGEYQQDAREYHGGSAVDNQALFDADGKPLESLYVFSHISSDSGQYEEKINLLENPGFEKDHSETQTPEGWRILNTTSGEYSKFKVNSEMNKSGDYAVHWYSPASFSDSQLTTEFMITRSGKYNFTANFAGEGSSYKAEVYINGKKAAENSSVTSGYDKWSELSLDFNALEGEKAEVKITVSGQSESYGSIDDCGLFFTDGGSADNIPSGKDKIPGDIDLSGEVDAADYILMKKYMMGTAEYDSENLKRADINDDGMVNIADVILLIQKILVNE